ncbi:hypothetical protein F2P56_025874 [Juglans regia]|uniref:PHD and RING finger domain-containing protein 1 n=2 Tax=Juglans regia TaxID=51240 RepID=A0A833X9P2_JUGRE|nr:uncharacterized protein LOC109003093 isoform X1 [Juglans regia]KAF5456385.1 hypothetical protein F2P56_025874 [Juglans regia]
MVMQSSLPSSTEATLFFVSDHGKVEDLCDWRPGTETWQMGSNCDKHTLGQCGNADPVIEEKDNANTPNSLNFPRSYAQPSNVSTISESCMPNFVYRRRKLRQNSLTIFSPQAPVNMKKSADCHSVISSDAPSVAAKEKLVDFQGFQVEHESHTVGVPTKASLLCIKDPCVFKSRSINGCSVGDGHASDDVLKSGRQKILEVDSVNDSCSSSQSNMEHVSASMETEVDDTGECSSSSVMAMEVKGEDLSENDLCISILRCQGLVGVLPAKNDDSTEDTGPSSGSSCSRLCNICGHSDTTMNMLICDHCEEAFHVSCLNPRMKKIPTDDDEWFCYSCLKKKCKIPKETDTIKSLSIASEMGRCRITSVKGDSNPILSMLRDTEPYKMGVRVGKGFQAEVPDWSGPIINDVDAVGEPVEMNPSVCVTSHEWNVNKPYTPNSICNWLQCRDVIDGIGEGVNGTICGKWRRAPLCEVQTDDWDCFRSVLWDSTHADCAVPQELETDQVLKQLKYIQMLRPQLAAKRRKSDHTKSDGDHQKPTVKHTDSITW